MRRRVRALAATALAAMLADEVSECEIAKEKHGIYFGQP